MGLKKITSYAWGVTTGVVAMIMVAACATPSFSYKWYPYDIKNHKLMGDQPKNDLGDSVCGAVPGSNFPCIIMLEKDFFPMQKDYLNTKQQLMDCQKPQPNP
jgi:hypothetical protein